MVAFHTPVRFPWTLNFFAVYGFFWLQREIRYYRSGAVKTLFEDLGEASYSIYLTHLHGLAILAAIPITLALPQDAIWFGRLFFCGIFVTAFYWTVERPSHRFARFCARTISLNMLAF